MEKVYVLTIDSADVHWGHSLETLVFGTLEKAKEHLQKLKTNFLADLTLTDDEYFNECVVEDEEMSYTWYEDGYYCSNRYVLHIEEQEIL